MDWLPAAMAILKDELPSIEVTVSSQYSPRLGEALRRGTLDLAFMRPEPDMPELDYRLVTREPLIVALPSDHPLTRRTHIALGELANETFIGMSATAPSLRAVIDDYLERSGVPLRAAHEVDNLSMAMSLIASTRGLALLPAYAENFLPWSVTSRPLVGELPTIDLVVGYNKANRSPILTRFLSRSDALVAHGARRPAPRSGVDPAGDGKLGPGHA